MLFVYKLRQVSCKKSSKRKVLDRLKVICDHRESWAFSHFCDGKVSNVHFRQSVHSFLVYLMWKLVVPVHQCEEVSSPFFLPEEI